MLGDVLCCTRGMLHGCLKAHQEVIVAWTSLSLMWQETCGRKGLHGVAQSRWKKAWVLMDRAGGEVDATHSGVRTYYLKGSWTRS